MSDFLDDVYSTLGFALDQEYTDILAFLRNSPRETSPLPDVTTITPDNVIAVASFNFNNDQKSADDTRYVGEGADFSTIGVKNAKLGADFAFPLISPIEGWVEPTFANLWDLAEQAYWGTSTDSIGLLTQPVNSGEIQIQISNIADFVSLTTPITGYIIDGDNSETVSISLVTKSTGVLSLNAPLVNSHDQDVMIAARPSYGGPVREPAFSLISLREGLMSPALVDKISIKASVGQDVEITVEVKSTRIQRASQIDMRSYRSTILSAFGQQNPRRIVNSSMILITDGSTGGSFGMSTMLDDVLFQGYEGVSVPTVGITSHSLTVDNHLIPIFTGHSLNPVLAQRARQNAYPLALVSDGRVIKGELTYKGPVDPGAILDRLSGMVMGLTISYGPLDITIPRITWSPHSSKGKAEGDEEPVYTLEWQMVADTPEEMPILGYNNRG